MAFYKNDICVWLLALAVAAALTRVSSSFAPTANKLLVLIDGRTLYMPLFPGVFWDAQDVLLEDVERIEVIGGELKIRARLLSGARKVIRSP